jgi:predicted permease
METLFQDLRYGARTLLKAPGFTAIAVIALALGIGANAAMFSIVNGVLFSPVPYPQAERLLKLWTNMPQFHEASVSYPNFQDWERRQTSFEHIAAFRNQTMMLTGQPVAERIRGEMVSWTYFPILGKEPLLGRVFTADDDQRGANPVVVLTSNFWKNHFGSDPNVIGRTLTLDDKLYTIVGVVPSGDVLISRATALFTPIGQWTEPLFLDRGVGMGMRVVGRLKPTVGRQQAQSEMDSIAAALAREYPKDNKDHGITLVSIEDDLVGDLRTPLLVLLGAVGFVLLIACANVANLLLARSTARRREFAVRSALGARRLRIVRQLLTEGVLLAIIGGGLALAVAASLSSVFVAKLQNQLPRVDQIHLNPKVLAFTAGVSLLASILFSLTPALRSARTNTNETLKESARGNTGRHRLQRGLVVAEVALALVLTAAAGLMMRSVYRLWSVNPGFEPQGVLTFGIAGSPATSKNPEAIRNGYDELIARMKAVPGVVAVSMNAGSVPLTGDDSELPYWIEGRPKPTEQSRMDMALFYGVTADYLNVMRTPLLRGRFLTPGDNEKSPCVTVIDTEFAKKSFPGQDPIGQRVHTALVDMSCEVVGVAGHVKHWGLDTDDTAKVKSQFYLAFRQFPDSVMDLASRTSDWTVRVSGNPYVVVPALKRAVAEMNGKMVLYGEQSMADVISGSIATQRIARLLLGCFAVLALVLSAVGIYGVVSYAVTQSTHDIGVRMALGADRRQVLAMVLGNAMRMALIGIVAGAALAVAATRLLKGMLYGVSSADPITFGAVAAVLALVTLIASYVPALRATRVDPMVALRYE